MKASELVHFLNYHIKVEEDYEIYVLSNEQILLPFDIGRFVIKNGKFIIL